MGTIAYNNWVDPDYIFPYGGGVFSANKKQFAAFDYFPDDLPVNEAACRFWVRCRITVVTTPTAGEASLKALREMFPERCRGEEIHEGNILVNVGI